MSEYIEREVTLQIIDYAKQRTIEHIVREIGAYESLSDTGKVYYDSIITTLDMCKHLIKEAVKTADVQSVDRWISVKDRLPDEMQDKSIYSRWSEEIRPSESVLILTTGGSYDVAWYSYVFNDWTTDNETKSYKDWEVAYWQPLPKNTKGELK